MWYLKIKFMDRIEIDRPSIERVTAYVILTAALITSIVNIVRDGTDRVVGEVEVSTNIDFPDNKRKGLLLMDEEKKEVVDSVDG